MSIRLPRSTSAVSALLLLFGAAACGSGSDSGDAQEVVEYSSPLGDFLGYSEGFDEEDEQEEYAEIERKAQELAVACMAAEGFEYQVVDYSEFEVFMEEDLEWGSKEYAEKYGFGASTQAFSQAMVGPDLIGHNYSESAAEESFQDPNEVYIESLTDPVREAYYAALYGMDEGPDWDEALSDEENEEAMEEFYQDYVPTGCMNVAYEDANGIEGEEQKWEEFEEKFGDMWEQMEERFDSDPRVIEIENEISSCMSEKGFEYDEEEIAEEFYTEINELQEEIYSSFDESAMYEEGVEAEDFVYEEPTLNAEQLATLADIQERELATAAAVVECNGGVLYSYFNPDLQKVRAEIEQEFLDENADDLAEFEGMAS